MLLALCKFKIRAPLKTYQDRDEYNFDFEQGDSVHRRAVSPSCADQRSSEPKCFGLKTCRLLCAGGVDLAKAGLPAQPLARAPCLHHSKSTISTHERFPEVPIIIKEQSTRLGLSSNCFFGET